MAISNVASGLRPGVCTSTTRPSAPYTGQIIYETDTGYLRVWDGSAWDYLSQSQNDTTNLPISNIGAAWTSWTPTISASSGSFTSVTCNQAKYVQINKTVIGRIDISITTNGTAAGSLQWTLPVTGSFAQSGNGDGFGVAREMNTTGNLFYCYPTSTTLARWVRYDNAYGLASGYRVTGTFSYEAA